MQVPHHFVSVGKLPIVVFIVLKLVFIYSDVSLFLFSTVL